VKPKDLKLELAFESSPLTNYIDQLLTFVTTVCKKLIKERGSQDMWAAIKRARRVR
jgi:hypothetical protein